MKQIEVLRASIARREKLLSNENYVKKAPQNIVDMDRQKLAEEKKKLAELESWQSYDLMLWFRYFWKGEIKNVKQSIIFDGFYCKE